MSVVECLPVPRSDGFYFPFHVRVDPLAITPELIVSQMHHLTPDMASSAAVARPHLHVSSLHIF